MNLGLPDHLKTAFPDITPMDRPLVTNSKIKDPYWLAGFTDGEGSFGVTIHKSNTNKIGYHTYLHFDLIQHNRDDILLKSFMEYLKCGRVYKHSDNAIAFKVSKYSDLTEKIIPFFHKYPILGVKSKDFNDFCLVAELMKNKAHLFESGLNQIRQIKAGMNTGRKFF